MRQALASSFRSDAYRQGAGCNSHRKRNDYAGEVGTGFLLVREEIAQFLQEAAELVQYAP